MRVMHRVKDSVGNAAGTIRYLYMFPLSFSEFCRVYGREEQLKSMDLFGENEEQEYKEREDINSCYDVIQSLLETFQRESGYYFQTSKEALLFLYYMDCGLAAYVGRRKWTRAVLTVCLQRLLCMRSCTDYTKNVFKKVGKRRNSLFFNL